MFEFTDSFYLKFELLRPSSESVTSILEPFSITVTIFEFNYFPDLRLEFFKIYLYTGSLYLYTGSLYL